MATGRRIARRAPTSSPSTCADSCGNAPLTLTISRSRARALANCTISAYHRRVLYTRDRSTRTLPQEPVGWSGSESKGARTLSRRSRRSRRSHCAAVPPPSASPLHRGSKRPEWLSGWVPRRSNDRLVPFDLRKDARRLQLECASDLEKLHHVESTLPSLELRDERLWTPESAREFNLRQAGSPPGIREDFTEVLILPAERRSGHAEQSEIPRRDIPKWDTLASAWTTVRSFRRH